MEKNRIFLFFKKLILDFIIFERMALEVESLEQFKSLVSSEKLLAAIFWAKWSSPSLHIVNIAGELSKQHSNIKFLKVKSKHLKMNEKHSQFFFIGRS